MPSSATNLYSGHQRLIIGFHATERKTVREVVETDMALNHSDNSFDWLGPGIYFWEGSLGRAQAYAAKLKERGKLKNPAVVGCVIDLGLCLDLSQHEGLQRLVNAHAVVVASASKSNIEMPVNSEPTEDGDVFFRQLDCAVICAAHEMRAAEKGAAPYDSVRAVFGEGDVLYTGAGHRQLTHVQVSVLNTDCIKGYFYPRTPIGAATRVKPNMADYWAMLKRDDQEKLLKRGKGK